jgi:hypothetical protein
MKNAINLIKSHVNLNGYSKSKGFIGFSERNQKFSFEIMMRVISFFLSYFEEQYYKFKLVTSLHFSDSFDDLKDDYDVSKEQYELLLNLQKANWASSVDYSKFGVDYDSDKYQNQIELLFTTFSEHELSNESGQILEQLLTAIFSIDGIDGHCFLVSKELGIIIYPHEDTGFGVISLKEKYSEKIGKNFLHSSGDVEGIIQTIS